jgi:uncharacterized protein (TIRG00374 family)
MAARLAKHRKTIVVLGLVASAVFMYLAVRRLDLAALKTVWANAHVFPWVPLGILSYVVGHVVRGLRCRLLVRREATLRLVTASNIVVVGYASNNVFPARLGELVRAGMLAERTGIPMAQSFMITFIERVLDGLAILLLLVIGTSYGVSPPWMHDVVHVALLVFGGATGMMLIGVFSPGLLVSGASRLGNKLGEKWHDRLVSLATSIANAGACLRDPRDAIRIVILSVFVWVLEAGLFIAILPAFGIPLSFTTGAVAMSVTNLGLLVPSSPGFVGPFHYFASQAVIAHDVNPNTALAYAAVVHLAFYVPVTIWGAVAMLWYGVEVGATAAIAREAQQTGTTGDIGGVPVIELAQLSRARADEPASAFTVGLVEAICVPAGQQGDATAIRAAADFVEGQIAALQPQLKVLFDAGMTFFRFVTRLRYLRGYCDLSLEKRRAWTARWAEGRIALLRKLFKPVRATALLAYYDHPNVRDALVRGTETKLVADGELVRKRATA